MNVALPAHDQINVLSICTGGGGLDLGLELALPSARSVVMVEREAFAVAHLVAAIEAGLLAPAAIWSDARSFAGRPWRGLVDGLIGGIPCQPHSEAGKQLGDEDERDLWSTARRIIVQVRPWFVVIENVRGIVDSGGLERILGDLRRLRFTVECGLFTAAEVGDSQRRKRVFVLGVADTQRDRWGAWDGGPSVRTGESEPDGDGRAMADAGGARFQVRRGQPAEVEWSDVDGRSGALALAPVARSGAVSIQPRRQDEADFDAHRPGLFPPGPGDLDGWQRALDRAPLLEPAIRRMADGLAADVGSRVDELRLLGNGVVPLEAAYAIRTLAARLARRGSGGATQFVRMMEALS